MKERLDQIREILNEIEQKTSFSPADPNRDEQDRRFFRWFYRVQQDQYSGMAQDERIRAIHALLAYLKTPPAYIGRKQSWTCKLCGCHNEREESAYECLRVCYGCISVLIKLYEWKHGDEHPFAEDLGIERQRLAPTKKKKKIPARLQVKVLVRDGGKCLACPSTEDLAVDHIVPESQGGTLDIDNLQTLCRSCNSRKRTQMIDYRKLTSDTAA